MIGDKNKINLKIVRFAVRRAGFSLIEMTVAIALFSVLVMMAADVLISARQGQKFAVASQNVQENMHFMFETISKEMRSAQGEHALAPCSSYGHANTLKVFNTNVSAAPMAVGFESSGNILEFKNRDGWCVRYSIGVLLDAGKLMVRRFKDLNIDGDILDANEDVVLPVTSAATAANPEIGIRVNSLNFYVVDDLLDDIPTVQPRVTMSMEIQSNNSKFPMRTLLQTTISSRRYE